MGAFNNLLGGGRQARTRTNGSGVQRHPTTALWHFQASWNVELRPSLFRFSNCHCTVLWSAFSTTRGFLSDLNWCAVTPRMSIRSAIASSLLGAAPSPSESRASKMAHVNDKTTLVDQDKSEPLFTPPSSSRVALSSEENHQFNKMEAATRVIDESANSLSLMANALPSIPMVTATVAPPPSKPSSRKTTSKRISVAREIVLYSDLPDVTDEAASLFQRIPDCLYGSKNIGSAGSDALDCECRDEWGTCFVCVCVES